jgi:uncharacterized protein (TIGR02266 family)
VSLRIKFRSATLDQFIERYAVDVSRGGIFIRTREPLAVGTQLRFDFQLQDGAPLLAGEGTIVWIRENDPQRAGVTPGMGVRFDKLSSASQPVLDKILAEKARKEQAGAPAKPGPAGGMAVRRPSSTFSALDPAAARAAQAAAGPPRVGGLSPLGAQPRAAAPATGSGPVGAQPRASASGAGSGPMSAPRTTAPASTSDPFGRAAQPPASAARPPEPAAPAGIPTLESSGAFGRPRSTTGMNAQRPAPAPSALFEKPTAEDIDRALSVLTEVGEAAPTLDPEPADFSARLRRPTDAQPLVVEAAADVGDAPAAAHRRPTDAQPMVLEAAPDVGEAPSRRTGTRPLFSRTGEQKLPTVPMAPLGAEAPEEPLHDEEEEDDATSAWVGSGPTRVGETEPVLPAAAKPPAPPATAKAPELPATVRGLETIPSKRPSSPALPATSSLPPLTAPAPRPTPLAVRTEAPKMMAPDFAAPPPKKGSGATIGIVVAVLVAAAAGGGYYVLRGPGHAAPSTPAPAPEATTAPPPPATPSPAPAPAPSAAAEPEKPAEKPAAGGAATPSSLRARPEGEAPKEAAPEAKPAENAEGKAGEAKAGEGKAGEGKSWKHKGKRHAESAAAAEAAKAPAEAAPAVADVSAKPPAEAPATPPAEAPAKPASSGNVLKITSAPAGAEVIVDGNSVGTTPFSTGDLDPALPHSVTIKKDGFEAYEHMIGGSDWPRAKNGVRTLKLNAKLRSTGGGEAAKPAEQEAPSEPPPGLGTTPASPKRE